MKIEQIVRELQAQREWLARAIASLERLQVRRKKLSGNEIERILRQLAGGGISTSRASKVVEFPTKVQRSGRR